MEEVEVAVVVEMEVSTTALVEVVVALLSCVSVAVFLVAMEQRGDDELVQPLQFHEGLSRKRYNHGQLQLYNQGQPRPHNPRQAQPSSLLG